jgi:protein-tyrosine kinase
MQEEREAEQSLVALPGEGEEEQSAVETLAAASGVLEQDNNSITQKLPLLQSNGKRKWTGAERLVSMTSVGGARVSRRERTRGVEPVQRRRLPRHEAELVRQMEEQCRSFGVAVFLREQEPVRSLGITSSLPGEGKSLVAWMLARVLAQDSVRPVKLVECDWEHAGLHEYVGLPGTPGLAEWLRGQCSEQEIEHQVSENLTMVVAGEGRQDAVRMLQRVRSRSWWATLGQKDELLVVDLPAVVTTAYSVYAASMVEAVVLVVRAGATPDTLVAQACAQLHDVPMRGLILNQVTERSSLHRSVGGK